MVETSITFYILVPVYKTERYLNDCIQSVLHQTYSEWRLILVDDGSPDRSGAICDELASGDCRIAVIHKENGGLLSARRAAIDYVLKHNNEGYLIFLDSDDLLETNALEVLAGLLKQGHPDLLMYECRRFVDCKELALPNVKNITIDVLTDKRLIYKRVFGDDRYNSLCKKAVNIRIMPNKDYSSLYYVSIGEDLLQSLEIYKCAKTVYFTDVFLYRYRTNPTSITHSADWKSYKVDSTVDRSVLVFLKAENVWTDVDFAERMDYCKELLVKQIKYICSFDASKENRRVILRQILADEYYRSVILHANCMDRILRALRKERYNLVFFICYCYRVGSRVKKVLRLHKSEC
jgi:glycosyltransferase involved in cell wall biosynthesis